MDTPTPTSSVPATPFNGGAPLTQTQIQDIRTKAGINTNPHTSSVAIPVADRLASLKAGTYAQTLPVNTNSTELNGNGIRPQTGENLRADGSYDLPGAIGNTFKQGAKQVTDAVGNVDKNAQDAGGGAGAEILSGLGAAGHVAGAVAGTAGGLIGDALSPFTPQSLKDSMSQGAQGLDEEISRIPGMTPELHKSIADVFNTVLLKGGKEVPGAAEDIKAVAPDMAGTIKTATEAPGKMARKLTTSLPSEVKNVAKESISPDAMIEHIKEMQGLAKGVQKGEGGLTPLQKTGNDLFGEKGSVTTAINEGREAAGEKMGTALKTPGVGDAKVDTTEALAKGDKFIKDSNIEKRVATLPASQRNLYLQFKDSLYELRQKGGATLQQTDQFLREWQGRTSTDPTLNKAITNIVHNVNEAAKNSADAAEKAAGIKGHPYRESNDEYRQYLQPHQYLQEARGEQNAATGEFAGAQKLLRSAIDNEGEGKTTFDSIRKLVGDKVTKNGMTMNDQAHLSTFVHDLYEGVKPEIAIKKLSLGWNIPMIIGRTLKNILGSGSPDAIVQRLIDVLEESK